MTDTESELEALCQFGIWYLKHTIRVNYVNILLRFQSDKTVVDVTANFVLSFSLTLSVIYRHWRVQ